MRPAPDFSHSDAQALKARIDRDLGEILRRYRENPVGGGLPRVWPQVIGGMVTGAALFAAGALFARMML